MEWRIGESRETAIEIQRATVSGSGMPLRKVALVCGKDTERGGETEDRTTATTTTTTTTTTLTVENKRGKRRSDYAE
ncbi:hypothetical protein K0M31_006973 [Melipona bicolor]|uniref:Uncharacterized protein n=1 Tax=Melipona bicolor TaxID=60889 RepID=A0AA40KL00_9HYME|nr:hypothetical protein K0M31_006973 [Melipona bicolor]